MKRYTVLFGIIVMAALVLSACQSATATTAPAAPAATTAPIATTAPVATTAPAATTAPVATSAPAATEKPAASTLPDLGGKEVRLAFENAYIPFQYIELSTGKPGGWEYDAWNEICKRLNCKPNFVETGWEGMIQAVADKQFDAGADGISITEDRAKVVDFSIPYTSVDQRLLVRADESRFTNMDEFKANDKLVIGAQTGSTNYETAAKYLPESRIKAFEQFSFAVQALIGKDVDAVLGDETAGQGYLGENKDKVKLIGPKIHSEGLGFIYAKGSPLVEPVNLALKSMMADGFLDQLNKKYFGPDFNLSYDQILLPTAVPTAKP
jgi:polar amino acid transport system substrate-binding protein